MIDEHLRNLERQVLGGDAAALERLKAAWLRQASLLPWLEALLGPAPAEYVIVSVTQSFASVGVSAFTNKPEWSKTSEYIATRPIGRERWEAAQLGFEPYGPPRLLLLTDVLSGRDDD